MDASCDDSRRMRRLMKVVRAGVKAHPPSFLVEYKDERDRRRVRRLHLPETFAHLDGHTLARRVKQALPASLCIDNQQMQHLLKELVRLNPTLSLSGGNQPPSKGVQFFATSPDVNLNTVSEQDLAAAKAHMDKAFKENAVMPGSPGFQYDIQADFSDQRSQNSWDSD